MQRVNGDHVAALLVLVNKGPFFRLLSMTVCDVGTGFARVEIDLEEKHHNPSGGIHGGVYASIIDTAAYYAAYCSVPEDAGLISIDLKVDNLAAVNAGRIIAEGKLIKAGRTICLTEATVKSPEGKVLAHGTSKLLVTNTLQTVAQTVAARGHEPLPLKFLS